MMYSRHHVQSPVLTSTHVPPAFRLPSPQPRYARCSATGPRVFRSKDDPNRDVYGLVHEDLGPSTPASAIQSTTFESTPAFTVLTPENGHTALEGITTVVLDCDGVLWRGSQVLDGVVETLNALRAAGKRVLFVTNNSGKSRRQYVEKFQGMGLNVSAHEIIATSYTSAAYLAERSAPGKALVLGNPGIMDEMTQAGITTVEPSDIEYCASQEPWKLNEFAGTRVDSNITSVVVAFHSAFTYRTLCYASACLRENPGCVLIASNPDAGDLIGDGRIMPGTGCIVSAVQMASGVQPIVVGKGGPWLLPFLCRLYDLEPSEACIIGDRMDTDIALGKEGGWRTILPLTGVTSLSQVAGAQAPMQPDFVVPGFSSLRHVTSDS